MENHLENIFGEQRWEINEDQSSSGQDFALSNNSFELRTKSVFKWRIKTVKRKRNQLRKIKKFKRTFIYQKPKFQFGDKNILDTSRS